MRPCPLTVLPGAGNTGAGDSGERILDLAATTIDEVLAALDAIIERAIRERSPMGYFPALYRTVTAKVQEGIEAGFFDDGARMERLDVVFANRYLDALAAFEGGGRPTRSWQAAFEAAARWRPIILQHLLVAINAHINLDLAIAAAQTAPGQELPGMRRDFDRINEVLASLVADVRRNVGDLSPWLGLIDRAGGRRNDAVINFSLTVARREAWRFATELAPIPPDQFDGPIRLRDQQVAALAGLIVKPGILSAGLLVVRIREGSDVPGAIRALRLLPPPALETVEARVRDRPAP